MVEHRKGTIIALIETVETLNEAIRMVKEKNQNIHKDSIDVYFIRNESHTKWSCDGKKWHKERIIPDGAT